MTRTLPWLNDKAKEKKIKREPASSSRTPQRGRESSPEDLVDLDLNPIAPETPPQKVKKRAARTPSTSPPPAPPDVEFMREGFAHDDAFMMVEDEFLSVAKTFTQHLHHAEYVRFKKLARSRGADVLEEIQRPVDGRTAQSKGVKLQMEAEARGKGIKSAMRAMRDGDEEGSSGEDEFMHDPQLAGLMLGLGGKKNDLSGMIGVRADTRASRGFEQSPRNFERSRDLLGEGNGVESKTLQSKAGRGTKEVYSDTDSEDDLDVASVRPKSSISARSKHSPTFFKSFAAEAKRVNGRENTAAAGSGIFKQYARSERNEEHSPSSGRRDIQSRFSPDAETTSSSKRSAAGTPGHPSSKRRADRDRKEREEKRKAKNAFDIPTFAI